MRFHVLVIPAAMLAIAVSAAPQFAPTAQVATQGEEITYAMPQGWVMQPVQGGGPEMKAHYAFYYQGMPCGELYLYGQPLAGARTVEQVFQDGLAKVRPTLPYYQARGTQKISVGGMPAMVHEFAYAPTGGNIWWIARTYTMISGSSVYTFFFQTLQNYFPSVQPAFAAVMGTVKSSPRPAPVPFADTPADKTAAGPGGGLTGDDLGLNFDLPPGWHLADDPAGAKYRQYDAGGSQVASLFIIKADETAGLASLFGAPTESAVEEALNNRIEREFKTYAKYAPVSTFKRKIAGYAGIVHDLSFEIGGRPVAYRWCAFAVPRKSDKPSVVVAPEVLPFAFMTTMPERAGELRKQWDAIIDTMRPKVAAVPVQATAAEPTAQDTPKRNPAWATPPAKTDGGLPALVEDQPEAGLYSDPVGRYKIKLPDGAVSQKTEDNASWFGMPGAKTIFIIHNCRDDEAAAVLAARFAAGKKSGGTPTGLNVAGREATISLFTAKDADGDNLAWVVASYKGAGLLIVINLPAKDYAGAQAWIGGLLRGVRFSAESPAPGSSRRPSAPARP
jgi:hypothetical protein